RLQGSRSASLYFELHDFDARCSNIAEPAGDAGFLPIEFPASEAPSAIRVSGHAFDKLASIQNDPDAGCRLRNRRYRLAGFQYQPPAADTLIVHDLHIAGILRPRRRRELPRLAIPEHKGN